VILARGCAPRDNATPIYVGALTVALVALQLAEEGAVRRDSDGERGGKVTEITVPPDIPNRHLRVGPVDNVEGESDVVSDGVSIVPGPTHSRHHKPHKATALNPPSRGLAQI